MTKTEGSKLAECSCYHVYVLLIWEMLVANPNTCSTIVLFVVSKRKYQLSMLLVIDLNFACKKTKRACQSESLEELPHILKVAQ